VSKRRYNRIIRIFYVVLALQLGAGAGCRCVKNKLGIGEDITKTEKGTYEWAIQKLLAAALIEDSADSWSAVRKVIHSSVLSNPARMQGYKTMNWPALQRKIEFLTDVRVKGPPPYTIMNDEEVSSSERRIFIENAHSSPTPVRVKKDPASNGEWRITSIP
jgi:hypothetical protein